VYHQSSYERFGFGKKNLEKKRLSFFACEGLLDAQVTELHTYMWGKKPKEFGGAFFRLKF